MNLSLFFISPLLLTLNIIISEMRQGACQVAVGDGNIFIAGGGQDQTDDNTWLSLQTGKLICRKILCLIFRDMIYALAYLFHPVNGWIKLPNMARSRSHPMCGLVKDREANKKIVVAGGYDM